VRLLLGVSREALIPSLDRLAAETSEEPERILVVTDAEDLGPIRRRGFAIEYLPPREEIEAEGEDYDAFVERRMERILADRDPRTVEVAAPKADRAGAEE
jgi:hypothetical protein